MFEKIVVILRKPPHGSMFVAEGLRAAVAVSARLETTVVSIEDSVYAFLKNVDATIYKKHLDFLKETEIPIFVDKDSLGERGLTKEDLLDAVEVKEHRKILDILSEADATVTF